MEALAAMVDASRQFSMFRNPADCPLTTTSISIPYGFVSKSGSSASASSTHFLCPPVNEYQQSKSLSPAIIVNDLPPTTCSSSYGGCNVNAKIVKFRGHNVAGFDMDGKEMICLPQVYEIFLKHLVGGLHTVYTKLKRLDINPTVCNVDQLCYPPANPPPQTMNVPPISRVHCFPVRALRSLGAIQPGVNRCKLLETADFEKLYDDCANTSTRPGRPSKRGFDDWSGMSSTILKKEKPKEPEQNGGSGDTVFTQRLQQLTPQQILMQHFVALSQKTNNFEGGEDEDQNERVSEDGTPLNLSKSSNTSENDSDSVESMRKEDSSPNNSVSDRGGSNSNSLSMSLEGGSSSGKNDEGSLMNKVMSLIEIASQQFKHEREELWRERNEIQVLRESFHKIVQEERNLRKKLESETRKCAAYEKRYKFVNRQLLLVKAELRRCNERQRTSSGAGPSAAGHAGN